MSLDATILRKRRVDAFLTANGLVRVYVPKVMGEERSFMLVPPGQVPKAARQIDSTTYELARWEDME